MAIVTLWMGIGSTFITRRTAVASETVIDQVEPQRPYEASTPNVKPNATASRAPAVGTISAETPAAETVGAR